MRDPEVLIVGAGPIGLALAADLGRRGVETLVIEKNTDEIGPAKMLEVSVRTLEFCRQRGIAERVRNWGFPLDWPLDTAFVTSMNGYELGRVPIPALGVRSDSDFSPERGRVCPQTWFDPILRDHARSFANVRIGYQARLDSFRQDVDGVTAEVRDLRTDKRERVRARYVVGCDGYTSTVRDLLGIEVRGDKHIDWSMTIYLRLPNFMGQHTKERAFRYVFVGPEGAWSFLTLVDGKDLWRLQLVDIDQTRLEAADIDSLIRRAAGREILTRSWPRRFGCAAARWQTAFATDAFSLRAMRRMRIRQTAVWA
jgi:2-polyprenyl-6-methoxyphenol hydroxylase-like FAD-dependent oxidoreductase